MSRRRRERVFVFCLIALLGAALYGRSVSSPSAGLLSRALVPGELAARGGWRPPPSTTVRVLGPWTGPALEGFWALVRPFTQENGIRLDFESTPDVPAILATRLAEGVPPDVAILPSVALAQHYARAGQLVPLRRVLDVGPLYARYPAGWRDLVSVDGEAYGLLYRASICSLVWYSPGEFRRRGWQVPATWSELVALGDRIAALGLSPWSLGLKAPEAGSEAGTGWVESILLSSAGPDVYDRWLRHEIPWTDPAVRQAFLRWGQLVDGPRRLAGGSEGARATAAAEAVFPLYEELPAAYLCLASSSAQALIAQRFPRHVEGEDYDFFALPPVSPGAEAPVVAAADVIVVFRDTPQVAALLAYLASAEAQAAWVQRGGFIALGADLDPARYPDPLSRRAARQFMEAPILRFAASAQMPAEVEQAFGRAVGDFVADPGHLTAILREVEGVAQAAYPQPGLSQARELAPTP